MPWDPMQGQRLAPAWEAAIALLKDGEWHPFGSVVDTMIESSDLLPKTCANLVHGGVRAGKLLRKGHYNRRHKRDTRMIKAVTE